MKNVKQASSLNEFEEVECYNLEYISNSDMTEILNWIRLVRTVQHKNIMTIKDIILQDSCINISFNPSQYGSLETLFNKKSYRYGISCETVISSMIYQICEGLIYLHHNMHIIHRGLCLNAVFIDAKGVIKLGKLNNCIRVKDGDTKSTDFPIKYPNLIPWYSPEIIEQEFYGYSYNSDVYSLGLLLATLFTARLPYDDCEPPLVMMKKISLLDIPTLDVIPERSDASAPMQDLFRTCTIHNPRERPNVLSIVHHDWLHNRNHCSKSSWKKLLSD